MNCFKFGTLLVLCCYVNINFPSCPSQSSEALIYYSNCDVNLFGVKVSTYCNLLERIILSQTQDALKQSLPLSSPRAMRQIERAIFRRYGNALYIPLYIDNQRPVESFLLTADNVINVGRKLSDDIMRLVEQMNAVEDTIMNFY